MSTRFSAFGAPDKNSRVPVPKYRQIYYTIFHGGSIERITWMGSYAERDAYEFGNVFLDSGEAARAAVEIKKLLHGIHNSKP